MEEPRATPMAKSILSLAATNTAVMCSLRAQGMILNGSKMLLQPLVDPKRRCRN